MRRITVCLIAILFSANVTNAGPIADAVKRAAQTARPVKSQSNENKMLWPGVSLLAAGGLLALYGFTHTTGAEISSNESGTSIGISEKHATGVGIAGLGLAGLGAFLLAKGQSEARPNKRVTFGVTNIVVRF